MQPHSSDKVIYIFLTGFVAMLGLMMIAASAMVLTSVSEQEQLRQKRTAFTTGAFVSGDQDVDCRTKRYRSGDKTYRYSSCDKICTSVYSFQVGTVENTFTEVVTHNQPAPPRTGTRSSSTPREPAADCVFKDVGSPAAVYYDPNDTANASTSNQDNSTRGSIVGVGLGVIGGLLVCGASVGGFLIWRRSKKDKEARVE